MTSLEPITIAQSKKLIALERVIDSGKKAFVEVGEALAEIRDSRLYQAEHKTFEDYCCAKWGFSRIRAHQLIEVAQVSEALPENVKQCLTNSRQVAAIARVAPASRVEVIEKAQAVAKEEERPMTAKDIKEVAQQIHDPGSEPVKPFSNAANDADQDSDALFQLKRWWKQAGKKDRKQFLRWVGPPEKKKRNK